MKRVLFVSTVLVFLGLVVGFFLSKKTGQEPTAPTAPVVSVDPPPRTVEFPVLPPGAQFVYEGEAPNLPAAGAVYHVAPATSTRQEVEERALGLAARFGFTASPSALWRAGIFAATWDTGVAGFAASFSKNIFSFSLSQRQQAAGALFAFSKEQVSTLVSTYVQPPTGATFDIIDERTSGFDGVVVLDGPGNLTGYSLGLSVLGAPVLTSEYARGWGEVITDGAGVVRVFSLALPFRTLTPAGEAPLISLSDAVANLNSGRGALLWITDAFAPEGYATTPHIMRAVIQQAELVYVVVGELLRPAYLMTGSGEDRGVAQEFTALVFASPF